MGKRYKKTINMGKDSKTSPRRSTSNKMSIFRVLGQSANKRKPTIILCAIVIE